MMRTKKENCKNGNSLVKMITIGAIIGLIVSVLATLQPQKKTVTLTAMPNVIEETTLKENVIEENVIKETIATGKLWWN